MLLNTIGFTVDYFDITSGDNRKNDTTHLWNVIPSLFLDVFAEVFLQLTTAHVTMIELIYILKYLGFNKKYTTKMFVL